MGAAPLAASDDWLALPLPRPLALGRAELSLRLDQAQRELWALGDSSPILQDADGQKVQRAIRGELDLRWQATHSLSASLAVPGSLDELALWTGGISSPRLDDPGVARSQGLGDLRLGLRQDWGRAQGAGFGWSLELSAPSGLGPFESRNPLAGTGDGRWQTALGFCTGAAGEAWSLWLAAAGLYVGGREAVVSATAPLAYDAQGPRFAPPGASGPLWAGERWGSQAALGLGWDWYRGDDGRHSLGLAAVARQLGPLVLAGQAVDGTEQLYVALQPELQARYGGFSALAGWQSPPLYAKGLPIAYYGELHFRLDYGF